MELIAQTTTVSNFRLNGLLFSGGLISKFQPVGCSLGSSMVVYPVFSFEMKEDWSKEIFAWRKNKMSRTYSSVDLKHLFRLMLWLKSSIMSYKVKGGSPFNCLYSVQIAYRSTFQGISEFLSTVYIINKVNYCKCLASFAPWEALPWYGLHMLHAAPKRMVFQPFRSLVGYRFWPFWL